MSSSIGWTSGGDSRSTGSMATYSLRTFRSLWALFSDVAVGLIALGVLSDFLDSDCFNLDDLAEVRVVFFNRDLAGLAVLLSTLGFLLFLLAALSETFDTWSLVCTSCSSGSFSGELTRGAGLEGERDRAAVDLQEFGLLGGDDGKGVGTFSGSLNSSLNLSTTRE